MNLARIIFSCLQGNILTPAISIAGMIKPFYNLWSFILSVFILIILIYFFTSFLYSILHSIIVKTDEEDDFSTLHWTLILIGVTVGVIAFHFLKSALHSLQVDFSGQYFRTITQKDSLYLILADMILATGILGTIANWIRIYQILIIKDITVRFQKLIHVLPYLSAFMTMTLLIVQWFFYSNNFNLLWYVFSFGIIYGLLIFFSYKDFLKMLQMRLSRSAEFEEVLSLRNIFILVTILLILAIVVTQVLICRTMSMAYGAVLLVTPFLVVTYLTPSKLFRYLKPYPRFTTTAARVLFFTRFTRKFIVFWTVITILLSTILSLGIFFEPGFKIPAKNLDLCAENVKLMGESMEQYMEQNKGYLPNHNDWLKESWILKIKENRKIKYIPSCPSGGKYQYKKWRNKKGVAIYEIRCSCGAHKRAHVEGFYPRYIRKKGLIKEELNSPKGKTTKPKNAKKVKQVKRDDNNAKN